MKNVESSCWSITWQKRRGDIIKRIDTDIGRYSGSTKKTLVIKDVCKEDEGKYQAFLSLESNGPDYKSRNTIRLYAIGGKFPMLLNPYQRTLCLVILIKLIVFFYNCHS